MVAEVPHAIGVFPVGRLDADTEGLLILTNDGDLTHRLTHPSYHLAKTYVALVEGRVKERATRSLVAGVDLDDGLAAARSARVLDSTMERSLVEIVMTEGRNREVRRMCDAIGHRVVHLVRVAIGSIRDSRLPMGSWRALELDEVRALYRETEAAWQDGPSDDEDSS